MKILIVRLDHLGDLMLMTPLVRALGRSGHSVDLVVPRATLPIFDQNPYRKDCFAIEDIAPGYPSRWFRLSTWIRSRGYDAILIPYGRPPQLLWSSFFSGVPIRLAMRAGWEGRLTLHRCLSTREAFATGRHFSDLQLDLARALKIPTDGIALDFFPRESEIMSLQETLQRTFGEGDEGPLVGIHPGCAGNTCNLSPRVYGELAELILAQSESRLVITGSTGERRLTEEWPESMRNSRRVWFSQGELDLRHLGALISQFSAYAVASTGPLHLASALKIRTISPFCPLPGLSPKVWGNCGGTGISVKPSLRNCEAWRKGAHQEKHCDFRGEVTAEMLWQQMKPLLTA